ncbi:MAG: hypothetical protein HN704_18315 [Bacteroidetes bacterium]|jgi:predicted HTH transcriptional regulator|nr:hypothetical protein [Bacteroidota bacterium]MBT7493558.1 hypothetical protein [Bacteroidota bacterium]
MKANSLSAYFDETNKRKFKSHCALIVRELYRNPGQHSYRLSAKLKLSNEGIKKRISDLLNIGIIEVCGEVKYYGNINSLYQIAEQLPEHPVNKISLRRWLKKDYPFILDEFNLLNL